MTGRVLAIGGSDSGAGAGIQADIKTVAALGGYATTALTALTAQNTFGVHEVMAGSPPIVPPPIQGGLDDIGAASLQTRMLRSAAPLPTPLDCLAFRVA